MYLQKALSPNEVPGLQVALNQERARRGRRMGQAALGRLAQLGERLPYKEDVGGSSPSSPTIKSL
jgi:hypothetical protein